MKELIGKKIKKIFMDGEYLKFQTDKGDVLYQVTGDCCSVSYFHDFIGVENLLKNGEVKSVEPIDMSTLEATDKVIDPLEKSIFDMVYQWGRVGIVVDFTAPAYQEGIKQLREIVASEQSIKERLRANDILHEIAMRTKRTDQLDLIEEAQRKILNQDSQQTISSNQK